MAEATRAASSLCSWNLFKILFSKSFDSKEGFEHLFDIQGICGKIQAVCGFHPLFLVRDVSIVSR